MNPKNEHKRTYWVEVEGAPADASLNQLRSGVEINLKGKKHMTKKASIRVIKPEVAERDPPVNYKKHPERTWLEISLTEGKNRQVRRMTAKVGHPTLRLLRVSIEELNLVPLKAGEITQISKKNMYKKLNLF